MQINKKGDYSKLNSREISGKELETACQENQLFG
jgi:hypothetical protein